MGTDLEVRVLCGGGSPKPRADGNGVTARWGRKEAGGKTHERRNTNLIARSSRSGDAAEQAETHGCQAPWR